MDVYGRINILGGRSVRLPALDVTEAIILDNDPLSRAKMWASQGADLLHVVDLNAAALGDYQNRELIDTIVRELDTPVQVAGGGAISHRGGAADPKRRLEGGDGNRRHRGADHDLGPVPGVSGQDRGVPGRASRPGDSDPGILGEKRTLPRGSAVGDVVGGGCGLPGGRSRARPR